VIYLKQYESPRFPEMRARKPLFAALLDAVAVAMNVFLPGRPTCARRLSCDFTKALTMNAMWSKAKVKSTIGWRCIYASAVFGCAMTRRWSAYL